MKSIRTMAPVGTALAAVLALGLAAATPTTAAAQNPVAVSPSETVNLAVGRGSMVRLPSAISDVFVAKSGVADVRVQSPTQIYLFGQEAGETTVYATNRAGRVVYSTNVRVGRNITTIDDMLRLAMPESSIQATPMNGITLLTGTVASPTDVEEAVRLVKAFVGEGSEVVARLRTATPLQVNLQVRIAEVSRTVAKDIGFNILSRDATGGFLFGINRGRNVGTIANRDISGLPNVDVSNQFGLPPGTTSAPFDPFTGRFVNPSNPGAAFGSTNPGGQTTTINLAGRLLGLDVLSALDLLETQGLVTTLANPNLTALSGETASFLAGGEFPVPISQTLGQVTVEYKQYGVSLAFTPFVLADGRISMRVRPEVSEITSDGAVTLNGFTVPATTTRRAETTVELGSGQSFMIAGLLRNGSNNAIEKAPFLGDIPILGSLFRSTKFRRSESELVIVITPYLVKPVSASRLTLPTDGFRNTRDADRILGGRLSDGRNGEGRAVPTQAPPRTVPPSVGPVAPTSTSRTGSRPAAARNAAQPGFKL